jgi:hypothetical protein
MASRGKVATNEEMEVFSLYCTNKNENGECNHPKKMVDHCLNDKKYCPRVDKKKAGEKPAWKCNYQLYLDEHDKIYKEVIQSEDFVHKLELRYPKIDVRATLDESKDYWRSDKKGKGYERKCSKSENTIDWEATYINAVKMAVYHGMAVKKDYKPSAIW